MGYSLEVRLHVDPSHLDLYNVPSYFIISCMIFT